MNEISVIKPPEGLSPADYDAIQDAVMETARGRWFLLEYARRQRAVETQRLADLVDRLERMIADAAPPPPPEHELQPTHETAAAVAERLSDIVWTMRERGVGDQFCAELEKQIRVIRTLRVELEGHQPAPIEPESPGPIPAIAQTAPPGPPHLEIAALEPATPEPAPPALDPRIVAFARIDAMTTTEKLALFC